METQFQYIVSLAKQYHEYSEYNADLFAAINALPESVVNDIYSEYGDPERDFKPVNLLRAEIARKLLQGELVTENLVNEIKEKIRIKDIEYFNSYNESFLIQLRDYPFNKRDLFANWQKYWSIFHTYFYRGVIKETVQTYLEQLSKDLQVKLNLNDYYTFHTVDFQGASNFGSEFCWLALYPITKESHKECYQFFIRLGQEKNSVSSVAGQIAGWSIKNAVPNDLRPVENYEDTLNVLQKLKPIITKLNKEIRNYFKFAPGSQASEWQRFFTESIIAGNFEFSDLAMFSTGEEMNRSRGLPDDSISNTTWNAWLFKTANIDDVVFATKGVNTCLGIGIIKGNYSYDKIAENYKHKRTVKWITDKVYQYKADLKGYKTLFRPDTFSPTKVYEFILNEYARLYPELTSIFDENNLKYTVEKVVVGAVAEPNDEYEQEHEENEPLNFWWLNANPKIWKIGNDQIGELQTYTTHNDDGNKRRIYRYFEMFKENDIVIGYESSPSKAIKAIYRGTKGIFHKENKEQIEFELTRKLPYPIYWNELKNIKGLENCEVFKNNQGSLFKLTEDEFNIIQSVIDERNDFVEFVSPASIKIKYEFNNDTDKPFIKEEKFLETVEILKRKKNIILQGPPGVGKTFIARKLAYEMMKEVNDFNIEMVQFHQSFSYEDFIQGLRPTLKGNFELKNGLFYTFCQRAINQPEQNFFFVIDEINRGNLSKIFGELMMLIEADKRDEKFALKLTYAEDEEDRFYVPQNLYIIGTMNTADRSLAIVDYALRRRFAFVTLPPDYGDNFRSFLSTKGLTTGLVEHICSTVTKVNSKIKEDVNLGEGFQIGHSYFCTFQTNEDETKWWNEILNFELKPLLEEIWFDDLSKVTEIMKQLSR
jgi:5-methylcytosine-specific restriction protein B